MARHFLEKYAEQEEVEPVEIKSTTMRRLLEYDWPGNVRELENVIRRIVSMGEDEVIVLPRYDDARRLPLDPRAICDGERESLFVVKRRLETQVVLDALGRASGNKTEAARLLGISRTALYKKMKVLEIEAS